MLHLTHWGTQCKGVTPGESGGNPVSGQLILEEIQTNPKATHGTISENWTIYMGPRIDDCNALAVWRSGDWRLKSSHRVDKGDEKSFRLSSW